MAVNFPGPYAVEINYSVDGLDHKMLISTQVDGTPAVGAVFSTINLLTKGGGMVQFDVGVQAFIDEIKVKFNNGVTFGVVDLFEYTPLTFDRKWISSFNSGASGTSGTATGEAQYEKFSFRTGNGGIAFITLIEVAGVSNARDLYPTGSPTSDSIMDYVVGNDSWIYARDNSYCVARLASNKGQNERVFRERFR